MITDAQTNFVYFSDMLRTDNRYQAFSRKLTEMLDTFHIHYGFLSGTRDIWCRDYMPIQVDHNTFIEYRYDPDYLQAVKYRHLKTYPDMVCQSLGLETVKTYMILDGGNVIRSANRVILTDKIFKENKASYAKEELVTELKRLFQVEDVIIIPWDKNDDGFGHADGMLRFIDDDHVLINGYFHEYEQAFQDKLYGALDQAGIQRTDLVFDVKSPDEGRNWAYINYLQLNDLIVVPRFGIPEDEQALEQLRKAFPGYASRERVVSLDANSIVEEGGALNCISWNILG